MANLTHPVKTILAPVDFSEVTQWVMTEAVELARKLNGRLVLLNVTGPMSINEDQIAFRKLLAGLHEHSLRPTHSEVLAGRIDATDDTPISGDSFQLIGEPVPVILEVARRLGADYVVMGSHGRSRLYDVVFGSVAEGVIRNALCPIMLVPSQGKNKLSRRKARKSVRMLPKPGPNKAGTSASSRGAGSRAGNARAR